MGLHAGPAMSGTIGSKDRMEYTVIGDTVNTTSRIENSTKSFGTDLLVTGDVVAKIGDDFKVEQVGEMNLRGRSESTKVFKVLGYKDESGEFIQVTTPYADYERSESA